MVFIYSTSTSYNNQYFFAAYKKLPPLSAKRTKGKIKVRTPQLAKITTTKKNEKSKEVLKLILIYKAKLVKIILIVPKIEVQILIKLVNSIVLKIRDEFIKIMI